MLSRRKNIVLCGFMGCGKSTVGKMLADRLAYKFVDTDEYIEQKSGMTIPQIFSTHGEQSFRDIEHKAICELAQKSNCVIATGGGALTFGRNADELAKSGIIVFINSSFENCWQRIKNSDRPLVASNSVEQMHELYQARARLYRSVAHIEAENNGLPENAAADIIKSLSGSLIIDEHTA